MNNNGKKTVKYVVLKNILGFGIADGEIRFDLNDGLNIISGSNGTGKTRFLNLLRFAMSDRLQPAWIRTDDKGEAEIQLFLNDGTNEKIEIGEDGTARRFFYNADGKKITLDESKNLLALMPTLGLDPAKFLADKAWKERIDIVVSALGLKLTAEQWHEKIGDDTPKLNFDSNALVQFEQAKDIFEEKRRDAGRLLKEFQATVKQLEQTMPAKIDIDFNIEINNIDAQIKKLNQDKLATIEIELKADREKYFARQEEIKQVELKLAQLKSELQAMEIEGKNKKEKITQKFDHEIVLLESKKQIYQSEREKFEKSKVTQGLIASNQAKADGYENEYNRFDRHLETIKSWKREVIANIPIAGLTVGEKDLLIDNRPWEVTNTGRKIEIFLQIARLLYKDYDLKLILGDNFESVGEQIRESLINQMAQQDEFQLVFAVHDPQKNMPFKIKNSF